MQVAERCSLACKAASLAALSALAGVLLAGPGPSRRTGWALIQPAVQAALVLLRSAHSAPLEVRIESVAVTRASVGIRHSAAVYRLSPTVEQVGVVRLVRDVMAAGVRFDEIDPQHENLRAMIDLLKGHVTAPLSDGRSWEVQMELHGLIVSIALEQHSAYTLAAPVLRLSLSDVAELLRTPNAPLAPPPRTNAPAASTPSQSLLCSPIHAQHPLSIVASLIFPRTEPTEGQMPISGKAMRHSGSGQGSPIAARSRAAEEEFVDGLRDVVISVLVQQVEGWVEASRVLLPGRLPASRPTSARSRAWLCRCGLALLLRILRCAAAVEHGAVVFRHARRVVECLLPFFGPDAARGRTPISLPLHLDVAHVLGAAMPLAALSLENLSSPAEKRAGSSKSLGDVYGPSRICQWAFAWLEEPLGHGPKSNSMEVKDDFKAHRLEESKSVAHDSECVLGRLGLQDSGAPITSDGILEVVDTSPQRGSCIAGLDSLQRSVHALGILSHFNPRKGDSDAAVGAGWQDDHTLQVHKQVISRLVHEVLLGPDARDNGTGFIRWLGCLATCVWPELTEFVTAPTLSQYLSGGRAETMHEHTACWVEDAEWLDVLHKLNLEGGKVVAIDEFSINVAHEAITTRDKVSPSAFNDLLLHLLREEFDDFGLCFAAAVHVCILLRLYDALEVLVCEAAGALDPHAAFKALPSQNNSCTSHYQQKLKLVRLAAVHLCLHSLKGKKAQSISSDTASFHLLPFDASEIFISSPSSVGLGITVQARSFVPCSKSHILSMCKPERGKANDKEFDLDVAWHETRSAAARYEILEIQQQGFLSTSLRGWWSIVSTQKTSYCSPNSDERPEPVLDIWFPLGCFYSFLLTCDSGCKPINKQEKMHRVQELQSFVARSVDIDAGHLLNFLASAGKDRDSRETEKSICRENTVVQRLHREYIESWGPLLTSAATLGVKKMPIEVLEVAAAASLDDDDLTRACAMPLWAIHQDECEWKYGAAHEGHSSNWWLCSSSARYLRPKGPCSGRRGKAAQRHYSSSSDPKGGIFGALLRDEVPTISPCSGLSAKESRASDSIDFVLWTYLKKGGIILSGSKHLTEYRVDHQILRHAEPLHSLSAHQQNNQKLSPDWSHNVPVSGDERSNVNPKPSEFRAFDCGLSWHDIASDCVNRLSHISSIASGVELPNELPNICEKSVCKDLRSPTLDLGSWSQVQRKVWLWTEILLGAQCLDEPRRFSKREEDSGGTPLQSNRDHSLINEELHSMKSNANGNNGRKDSNVKEDFWTTDRNTNPNEEAASQLVSRLVTILAADFASFNCKILGLPIPLKASTQVDVSHKEVNYSPVCSVASVEQGWAQTLRTIDYMVRALSGLGCPDGALSMESIVISESRCLWHAAASALLYTSDLPRRFPSEFSIIPSPQCGLDGAALSEEEFLIRWKQLKTGLQSLSSLPLMCEEAVAEACESMIGTVSLLCQYQPPALIEASVVYHHSPSARRSSRYALPASLCSPELRCSFQEGCSPSSSVKTTNFIQQVSTADAVVTNPPASVVKDDSKSGAAGGQQLLGSAAFLAQNNSPPSHPNGHIGDAVTQRGWFDGLFGVFIGASSTKESPIVEGAHGAVESARRESWTVGKHSASDGKACVKDGGPGFPLKTIPTQLTDQVHPRVHDHVENHPVRSQSRPGSFGRRSGLGSLSTAESTAFVSSLLHRDLSLLQQDWPIDALDRGTQWLRLRRNLPRRIGTIADGKTKICAPDQCGEMDAAGPDDECLVQICALMQNVLRGTSTADSAPASPRIVRVAMWGLACLGPLLCHGGLSKGGSGTLEAKDRLAGEVMQTILWASTSGLATDPLVESSLIIAATALSTALGAAAAKHASTLSKLVKTGLEAPYSSCRSAAYRAIAASVAHLSTSLPAPSDPSGRQLHDSAHEPGLIRSLSSLLPQMVGPRLVGREGCWAEAVLAWEMVFQLLLRCPSTREPWAAPVAESAGRILASEEAPGPVVRIAARCVTLLLLAGAAVTAADTVAAGKGPHSTFIAGLTIQATRVCLGWGPATPGDVVARLCGAGRREVRWLLRLLPPFLVAAVPTRACRGELLLNLMLQHIGHTGPASQAWAGIASGSITKHMNPEATGIAGLVQGVGQLLCVPGLVELWPFQQEGAEEGALLCTRFLKQVQQLIYNDQDSGGPSAQLVLFMLLSIAAAGPFPSFADLVASLHILQDRRHLVQVVQTSSLAESESVHMSGVQDDAALWLVAGLGAGAAIPALRVAAQAGSCAENLAGLDVVGGHQSWKESIEAGRAVWDALGRCRHSCWRGILEGLSSAASPSVAAASVKL